MESKNPKYMYIISSIFTNRQAMRQMCKEHQELKNINAKKKKKDDNTNINIVFE